MSITTKALQFALEAKHAEQDGLAEAVIESIDMMALGVDAADANSTAHLLKTFIDVDLLPAAVRTIEQALKSNHSFNEDVMVTLLRALAQKGAWRQYNGLLLSMAKASQLRGVLPFTHHLLNQLELKKAAKVIQILEEQTDIKNSLEAVALLIARGQYSEVEQRFSSDPHLMGQFVNDASLCHWLYLFLAYREEKWGEMALDLLQEDLMSSKGLLDNYAHFFKLCLSKGWHELCQRAIQGIEIDFAAELLRKNLIFCRVYVFCCQKYRIYSQLLEQLTRTDGGFFSEAEIWSIKFKQRLLDYGLEGPLAEEFGKLNAAPGNKNIIILPLVVYGAEYVSACRDFFIKSALAAEDFLALAKRFHFTIKICTNPESIEELREIFSPLREHGFEVDLHRGVYPTADLPHKRMWPYLESLYEAEVNGGVFLSLCPDGIFGNGIGHLVDVCPEGGAAGGGLFRASWSGAERSLRSGELDVVLKSHSKNLELVELGISKWKHYSQRLFFENLTPNYHTTIQNGARFNSWQGTPTVIRPNKGFTEKVIHRAIYRYSNTFADHICQDLDHEFIGVLNKAGLLRMVKSYEDFVFVELAKDAGYSQLWKFQVPMGYELPTPVGEIFPMVS